MSSDCEEGKDIGGRMTAWSSAKYRSYQFLSYLLRDLPGPAGIFARSVFYQSILGSCGDAPTILEGVFFESPRRISIGDRVGISRYCILQGGGGIEIGDDVLIGPYSMVESVSHNRSVTTVPIGRQGLTGRRIVIENGVWLGTHTVILDGVTLGEGCIVAAGAVVTDNVGKHEIVGGVPAKRIGSR